MTKKTRKLFRQPSKGRLGGVCAGLADYFDIDANVIPFSSSFYSLPDSHAVAIPYNVARDTQRVVDGTY